MAFFGFLWLSLAFFGFLGLSLVLGNRCNLVSRRDVVLDFATSCLLRSGFLVLSLDFLSIKIASFSLVNSFLLYATIHLFPFGIAFASRPLAPVMIMEAFGFLDPLSPR